MRRKEKSTKTKKCMMYEKRGKR
jgi:hypothetical protein